MPSLPFHSAELNDGESRLAAKFSASLADKVGAVKPHAVLKITDVCFAENAATINAFEIVEDAGLTEEYASENTPPASKKLKTESGASAPAKRWQPIASLNPYNMSWTVKAKLASKGNVRTFRNAKGEGKVMTVEFVDEAGTAIQATMWKDAIDKYDQIMEVGKVYYVGKGSLRPANKKYSSVNNDYEMSLDGRSEIELCADAGDELARKMSRAYDLVKIDKLPLKIGGRASVDVVAIVTSVGELGSVRRKSDNAEIQRRDVVLLDETKKTVSLTLWNQLAVEQGEQLATMDAPVVALRGLLVTDYNGVSLSTVARSELFVEPSSADLAEADVAAKVEALRAWYAESGKDAETTAAGEGLATARGPNGGASAAERKSLAAMQPELLPPATAKPEQGVALAHVTLIKPDQPMYYCACPEEGNNKKVVEENGKWYCEATQKTYDTCRRRYILRMKVSDASGAGWVNVFHDQACEMLGCDAETLHALRESDPSAYERKVKAAQFNAWSLKIRSKTEEYQGESRRRLTVVHCAKPDFKAEAKHLLGLIQAK